MVTPLMETTFKLLKPGNSLFFLTLFFSVAGIVISCRNDALKDEFKPIPNQSWNYNFVPSFEVKVADKQMSYRLKVNLRITADYKYANLFILMHQVSPDKSRQTKRIELRIADKDGRWLGKGVGSLYNYQITYDKDYYFPDTGTYRYEIEQNMRDSPLRGVSDVGICIEPNKKR